MEDELTRRIASDPRYQDLKARRSRFGWLLTILMFIVYYGFILTVAWNKEFLSRPLGDGVITVGMPVGFGVIIFTIIITIIYVQRANTAYDAVTEQIVRDVTGGGAKK